MAAAVERAIKDALLDFNWGGYGMDDVDELASNDPDVGVFDELAAFIADRL